MELLTQALPELGTESHQQLAHYLVLVNHYSSVLKLTSFNSDPSSLVDELVSESLKLLAPGDIGEGWQVVDLGSGNGSPVIPLAIVLPRVGFTAVESNQRKASFLRQAKTSLHLGNLSVIASRVEEVAHKRRGYFNMVTSRAYAPLIKLLPQARGLLAPEGEVRGFAGADLRNLADSAAANGFSISWTARYNISGKTRHVYRLYLASVNR